MKLHGYWVVPREQCPPMLSTMWSILIDSNHRVLTEKQKDQIISLKETDRWREILGNKPPGKPHHGLESLINP
jgi:hypothetical protein